MQDMNSRQGDVLFMALSRSALGGMGLCVGLLFQCLSDLQGEFV